MAAILVVFLPITCYSAAKYWGLLDFFERAGMENTSGVVQVSGSEMTGEKTFSNQFADYRVKEALYDKEIIYMVIEAKPASEDYLLVPEYCMEEDDAGAYLKLMGAAGQTIQEYADSQGQQIVRCSVALFEGEELSSCTLDEQHLEDGTVYYCITGTGDSATEDITLNCVGTAYTKGMSVAERAEYECTLFNRNSSVSTEYRMADESLETELGIGVDRIEISETGLGMYTEITYHKAAKTEGSVSEAGFESGMVEGLVWELVNHDGTPLDNMPYYNGTGTMDNGDGTYTVMMAYQKPENTGGFAIVVNAVDRAAEYGPYEILSNTLR